MIIRLPVQTLLGATLEMGALSVGIIVHVASAGS
jgi:hypothetical protein